MLELSIFYSVALILINTYIIYTDQKIKRSQKFKITLKH